MRGTLQRPVNCLELQSASLNDWHASQHVSLTDVPKEQWSKCPRWCEGSHLGIPSRLRAHV